MDYTDLVFFGEREIWGLGPPRGVECRIIALLLLPSPIPYILSTIHYFIDLCKHAQCAWNLQSDAADYTDLIFFGERPLWVPNERPQPSVEPLDKRKGKSAAVLVECQCCFMDYYPATMACCPADHVFCSHCLSQYASTQLGGGNPDLICMDTSGCNLPFDVTQQNRFLSPKLLTLRNRLVQRKELKEANIECFEECPFCDWGCIIEIPVERDPLLRCQNRENGCGIVSCRKCKKKYHAPNVCGEDEAKKEARLVIEEAMSKALVRNCPNCNKAFIKTDGCNKMTCPQCMTASCYLCRQVVTNYEHFYQNAPGRNGSSSTETKCLMYDPIPLDEQHSQEVQRAYEIASSQYPLGQPSTRN